MLFLEMEENKNEKETESGKNKEKRAKKPKKKDKVKDSEDPQKTKKTTKKDRKRNLHLQQTNVPTTVVCTFTHTKASWCLVIAEKNLEVLIHQTESVSEMKSLEKDECEDSGQEEKDKSKSPPTQSPQRKRQLDICEP